MIGIERYDGQEGVAEAVYELLQSVYQSSPWTLDQVCASLAGEHEQTYLAYDGHQLLGCLVVQTVLDEMEILQIAVRPDCQRRGIASQLLACVKEWAGPVFLEVRASNVAAQALYTRQHFTKIGKRKNYYREPLEDAVIMKRSSDEG